MKFQVQRDTLRGLCSHCQHGLVYERATGQIRTLCSAVGTEARWMPPDVVRCTDFVDARQTSKYEMEKIAWMIRHDKSGAIRGFEPPRKSEP